MTCTRRDLIGNPHPPAENCRNRCIPLNFSKKYFFSIFPDLIFLTFWDPIWTQLGTPKKCYFFCPR